MLNLEDIKAHRVIVFTILVYSLQLLFAFCSVTMHLLYHSSSGTSGEEEKGQSQEVDQKVSCSSFPSSSISLDWEYFKFYKEEVRLNLGRAGFILLSNACFSKVSRVRVDLAALI